MRTNTEYSNCKTTYFGSDHSTHHTSSKNKRRNSHPVGVSGQRVLHRLLIYCDYIYPFHGCQEVIHRGKFTTAEVMGIPLHENGVRLNRICAIISLIGQFDQIESSAHP